MSEPQSRLTRERPDIWQRALSLATDLTGYVYAPKLPLADGTIYACGGGYSPPPPTRAPTPEERDEMDKLQKERDDLLRSPGGWKPGERERFEEIGRILEKIQRGLLLSPVVAVPEGAVEWLLHEVGHYIAASAEERLLPNYGLTLETWGHNRECEIQAWAFEEIMLSPWGSSRYFAPPEQRDGDGFERAGPLPVAAFERVEREMRLLGVDLEPWRMVCAEWIAWERRRDKRFGLN